MKFSVIIPAHNEGPQIASALRRLREISKTSPIEIIVVDGGSDDDTAAQARELADQVIVQDKPNRGAQLHAGAMVASGELLLFLRADAQPPGNWQQALERCWLTEPPGVAGAVFTVDYGRSFSYRFSSWLANLSAVWRGLPSGDHGFCTSPEIYRRCGGFPAYPVLEDVVFAERLKSVGRIVVIKERIWPAARQLHSRGPLSCALSQYWREFCFRVGIAPERLINNRS